MNTFSKYLPLELADVPPDTEVVPEKQREPERLTALTRKEIRPVLRQYAQHISLVRSAEAA